MRKSFLSRWRVGVGLVSLLAFPASSFAAADPLATRVIILANSDDPDSLRIARHYAEVRDVPADNIIALPMAQVETISWPEFIRSIWNPLETQLVQRKWIDAVPMDLTDGVDRKKYFVSGHRIAYLVVCRGVPLRIRHDPALYQSALPFTNNAIFRTNAGAVDGELSLLAQPNHGINAYSPNPLFGNEQPSPAEIASVVKVSRLDGPSADDALALPDRAIAAERNGLLGRAYVDIGGNHPDGDRWLELVVRQLTALHFDTDVDRAPTTIPLTARFDAPVLYFGWYAGKVNGPFSLSGFRFPPGAIALHIHSYSATTLRNAESGWCGPFIARGVTATVGNVFEPYLQLTHRPDLLLRALARGENFGDAVCYAQPALSWQTVAIGDPLYHPFAVSVEDQWARRSTLPDEFRGYAVVRKMKQLDVTSNPTTAIATGISAQSESPTLAVGIELARRHKSAGDTRGAADALNFVAAIRRFRSDEWSVAREAAQILTAGGETSAAVEIYHKLIDSDQLSRGLLLAWLPEAEAAATTAGNSSEAERWHQSFAELESRKPLEKK